MNFNQLENFLCVCEELSFTKASHKLYVSQPALSQPRGTEYRDHKTPGFPAHELCPAQIL